MCDGDEVEQKMRGNGRTDQREEDTSKGHRGKKR